MDSDKEFDKLEKIDSIQVMNLLKKVGFAAEENKTKKFKFETDLIMSVNIDELIIRKLKPEDCFQFSELDSEFKLIMNDFDPLYGYSDNNPFFDNIENQIYVALIGEKIIGYLSARFYNGYFKQNDYICCIEKIYILPQYRKYNIGKSLVGHLYDYANFKGAEYIVALVMPENVIAEPFFKSLDFRKIAKESYVKEIQKSLKK